MRLALAERRGIDRDDRDPLLACGQTDTAMRLGCAMGSGPLPGRSGQRVAPVAATQAGVGVGSDQADPGPFTAVICRQKVIQPDLRLSEVGPKSLTTVRPNHLTKPKDPSSRALTSMPEASR